MSQDEEDWPLRPDGSRKGPGFFGPLQRPDGDVSTEISVGIGMDGEETDIPTIVPSLSHSELQDLLTTDIAGHPERISDAVVGKAARHARVRKMLGRSPFVDAIDLATSPRPGGDYRKDLKRYGLSKDVEKARRYYELSKKLR